MPSLDFGGMRRAIGRGLTNPLNKMKAPRVHGYMRTCIERKAIRAMRNIGIVELGSRFAEIHWMRSGEAS